jgi:hypothetical protein
VRKIYAIAIFFGSDVQKNKWGAIPIYFFAHQIHQRSFYRAASFEYPTSLIKITEPTHASRLTISSSSCNERTLTSEYTYKKERADIGSFFLKKNSENYYGVRTEKKFRCNSERRWLKGKQQLVYIDLRENCRFNKIRLLIQRI